MANAKISDLSALAGSGVDPAADVLPIVDTSVTTTKKILVEELGIALNATQAGQEAGTSTKTLVSPAVQKYHPSAVKAWGLLTPATTITVSYPSAGVSATNPSSGTYVVTHGVTFSSANYAVLISIGYTLANLIYAITARDATTFTVQIRDNVGNLTAPTSFSYSCMGDL